MAWFLQVLEGSSGTDTNADPHIEHVGDKYLYFGSAQFFQVSNPALAIGIANTAAKDRVPTIYGPYGTLALAQAAVASHPPVSLSGSIQQNSPGAPVLNAVTAPIADPLSFLDTLLQPSTWLRVAEVALGIILIAVAVAKLTKAAPVAITISRGVAKVGKAAGL